MRTFNSVGDFFRRFFGLFRGPSMAASLLSVTPKFREKLFLTVTLANNCFS
jgi:hypothetical protein